eukprot:7251187-Pyramimonas_sp.AAC.1
MSIATPSSLAMLCYGYSAIGDTPRGRKSLCPRCLCAEGTCPPWLASHTTLSPPGAPVGAKRAPMWF